MLWVKENLTATLVAGGLLLLAVLKWGRPLVGGFLSFLKQRDALRSEVQELTGDSRIEWKRKCQELLIERSELREALKQSVLDADIKDEIREQDRYTIRLLKERLRKAGIDYEDVDELVRTRFFKNHL